MKQLTTEDLEINRSGTLTKDQLWSIKSKGVVNAIAGACFLVFVPMGYFAANLRSGVMLTIWTIGGSLFAAAFFWSAWGYLFIKREGHEIQKISGKVELKNSGNKNVILRIGDRSFFLRKTDVSSVKDGQEYDLYFLENPKVPLGWTRKSD